MSVAIRACVASIAVCLLAPVALAQVTIYVDADATGGANNGTSWANAFTSLVDGLAAADLEDEIRIAQGTYRPTGPGGSRVISFIVAPQTTLKGGYAGFGEVDPDARDVALYETILSGDLNGDDASGGNNSENSYTVAIVNNGELDGVIIEGGNANGFSSNTSGGGIIATTSLSLVDCVIRGNVASQAGGGVLCVESAELLRCAFIDNQTTDEGFVVFGGAGLWLTRGTVTLQECRFIGNASGGDGGGLLAVLGEDGLLDLTVARCAFINNTAQVGGGGAFIQGIAIHEPATVLIEQSQFVGNRGLSTNGLSSPAGAIAIQGKDPTALEITSCVVTRNAHPLGVGGVRSSFASTVITNTIVWDNDGAAPASDNLNCCVVTVASSCIGNLSAAYSGNGNIDVDPQLTNVQALLLDPNGCDGIPGTADDFVGLAPSSPCIDAGSNALVPADTLDLDGDLNTIEPLPFDIAGNPRFVDVPGVPDTGVGPAPVVDMGAIEADFAGKTWVDYAQGLAGTHGEPVLCGAGTLLPLDPLTLTLTNALESTTAWLTFGIATLNAPFKGGILVPDINPPGFVLPLPTGPTGTIPIAETWPDLGVGGFSIFFQYWIQDPAGPVGFSASNAIEGVVP